VIVVPSLMLILLACVDFGRYAYGYIALNNAVRAGASYGIMNNYSSSTFSSWSSGITTAAQQEMNGQMGYSSSNLSVSSPVVTVESNGLRNVQLTATYPFQTLVHWPGIPSGKINMKSSVTMRLIR
jgi:Flp pilus assembly protein TadG